MDFLWEVSVNKKGKQVVFRVKMFETKNDGF